jgi:threonyl-tRNA synthetase
MLDDDDHRNLARRLDLLHFEEDAPGMPFWHPPGYVLYRLLEDAARARVAADGYRQVRTPQILRRPIWEASGHWKYFSQGMFRIADQACEAAVKPVSCPGHIQIARRQISSYRDLPLRLAELGVVHRDEPGGTLHGLLRLRQFTQDDGHVFCTEEQVEGEVERFCRSIGPFYAAFGFQEVSLGLATRPAERAGDDASWDRAERLLAGVLDRVGMAHAVLAGGGAFYGPKLEFALADRLGHPWQCGTIQLDLVMPARFGLGYKDAGGAARPLLMLHRALYGSLERFMGLLLERHAGLPAWLAPTQVRMLPVAGEQGWAEVVERALAAAGLRVVVDGRAESLARRIAEAHAAGVPFQAVVGARERAAGAVSLRGGGAQRTLPLAGVLDELRALCAPPAFATPVERTEVLVGGLP